MFKVGNKVVPHSKSTGVPWRDENIWNEIKRKNKHERYIYIVRILPTDTYHDEIRYVCNKSKNSKDGNFYLGKDLTLFNDGMTLCEFIKEVGGE